jgi:hypothetical protein
MGTTALKGNQMDSKITLSGMEPDEQEMGQSDPLQECEQKIEDLEARVSALEAKAGQGPALKNSNTETPSSKAPGSGFYGG